MHELTLLFPPVASCMPSAAHCTHHTRQASLHCTGNFIRMSHNMQPSKLPTLVTLLLYHSIEAICMGEERDITVMIT